MSARTPLLLVALGATLVVGSTGGAVAGAMITGAQIRDGSITSADVRNGSLKAKDLAAATRAGLGGSPGPAGPAGAPGPAGAAGPSASDHADSTLPSGTALNSFGGSAEATSVVSQTITVAAASRLVVTAVASFGPGGASTAESSVECTVWLRPQGGPDSAEVAIGASQSDLENAVGGRAPYITITALGGATRGPGSWTAHLRCSDSLSQPATLGAASLVVVATADAG